MIGKTSLATPPGRGWVGGWSIQQVGPTRECEVARGHVAVDFGDHRAAIAGARAAGMPVLEAMHAKT
ncbi:hypothetical protein CKY51_19835 [Xanthomonas maliensis]|nr:hypothetical protein CKY51_19835 [Xanthomonas maliensis]